MQKTKLALLFAGIFAMPATAHAEETEISTSEDLGIETLETIVVQDTSFSQQIGTQKITEAQIKRRPSTNGNITELLKSNPTVAFSNQAETSIGAGEIKPEEISFHGEKFYNNNFTVDGITNNDNMNPASGNATLNAQNGMEVYELPSEGSQSMWIDSSLLKSVEAFDSNVSAKYGNFTGGVVNAEIKDPEFDKQHGRISYRTTRGSWAKFHVQDKNVDDFYKANRYDFQPEFTKNIYSVSVSQPLSENTSLLFSYNRTESDIKYLHPYLYYTDNPLGYVTETQKRVNETYLLKGVHIAENGDIWKATFMYSPHKSKSFKPNVVGGGYSNNGGGYNFNLTWDKEYDNLKMNTVFSYKRVGNEIEHDVDTYRRYVSTGASGGTIDWRSNSSGYALYGGYGSYKTQKDTYTIKQNYSLKEFDLGDTSHKLIFGWSAELAQAKYKRDHEAWQYYYESANISCNGMNECIEGEQYATSAQAYAAKNVKVNDSSYAAYIEDRIKWKNVDLNLGARVDYNQYLKNVNVAPRISINYDVFSDGNTNIFGGYNRYYANSMLAYKLREGIGNRDRWYRNASTNYVWTLRASGTSYPYATSDLETPYSDEFVLGVGQKMWGIDTVLKWVHRNGRDQFTRKTINGYYTLTNDGWSKNDNITLSFDKIGEYKFKYANMDWGLSFRYNKNETSGSNYDANATYFDNEYAVYNGRLIQADDLPSNDYNSKWAATLNVNTEFPSIRLTWDQRLSWVGAYDYIKATSTSINCQYSNYQSICGSLYGQDIDATVYEDASIGSQLLLDWRFAYKQPITKDQYIEITLDVNNVLDSKAKASSSGSTIYYKMGRNFWLGASYNW